MLSNCASRRARCRCRRIWLTPAGGTISHCWTSSELLGGGGSEDCDRAGFTKLTDDRLLKLSTAVQVEEFASSEREDHALVVLLEVIVDPSDHQRSQRSFGKGFIFVERLSKNAQGNTGQSVLALTQSKARARRTVVSSSRAIRARELSSVGMNLQLVYRIGHLGPEHINLFVQPPQRISSELGVRLGEEADEASRRRQAHHVFSRRSHKLDDWCEPWNQRGKQLWRQRSWPGTEASTVQPLTFFVFRVYPPISLDQKTSLLS